jgi:hypothetical protein
VPAYWYRPPRVLSTAAGMHRFFWDMRYQQLPGGGGGRGGGGGLPMQAIGRDTAPASNAPWVAPGQYTVKLTAGGKTYSQPITVKMDPRVKTSAVDLAQIASWSKQLYQGVLDSQAAVQQMQAIRDQGRSLQEKAGQEKVAKALAAFDQKAVALQGTPGAGGGRGGRVGGGGGAPADVAGGRGVGAPAAGGAPETLASISSGLSSLIGPLQAADAMPPAHVVESINERLKSLAALKSRWASFKSIDLPALNAQLKQANLPAIEVK